MSDTRHGVVIFTGDKTRLAAFYEAVTGLEVRADDESVTVLASPEFELVIHALPGEPKVDTAAPREDVYIKPSFPVKSLAEVRAKAEAFGGRLRPAAEEWGARGFRASEATDPDGNVIQFREASPPGS